LVASVSDDPETRVDLYVCYNETQADRLVDLLAEEGIEVLLRDKTSTAFPLNVGTQGERIIAVREIDFAKGAEVIQAAIADEVVSADGRLLCE
jgi:hypothetical protein